MVNRVDLFVRNFDADQSECSEEKCSITELFTAIALELAEEPTSELQERFFLEIDNRVEKGLSSAAAQSAKKVFQQTFCGKTETEGSAAAVSEDHFLIPAEKHPRYPNDAIMVHIGKIEGAGLDLENLADLFDFINQYTLHREYPIWKNSRFINGILVHRPNHNGTHSARKTRHLIALFDFIQKRGSETMKSLLQALSEEEKQNLLLGAYLMRAGRVDESGNRGRPGDDDYASRSAFIYEQYAKQLLVSEETIGWVKKLIVNGSKPESVRDPEIAENEKCIFGCALFGFIHNADLVRCFSRRKIEGETSPEMKSALAYFTGESSGKIEEYIDQWLQFSLQLCSVTGPSRNYDSHPGDGALFAQCSTEGKFCWEILLKVPNPEWE